MQKGLKHFLLFIAILALLPIYVSAQCYDLDGDGYGIGDDCSGEDCNDNDPYVNPGMADFCGNGIDDNCNGEVDEAACSYCPDYDSDGYGDPGSADCSAGPETDCDNYDQSIKPEITEGTFDICTDALDNNCNGLIDQDDPECAEFYPPPGGETTEGEGVFGGGSGEGEKGCQLSSPVWLNFNGDSITNAESGEDPLVLSIFGLDCLNEDVIFEVQKEDSEGLVDQGYTFFGEYYDENEIQIGDQAIYITRAPEEEGSYVFKATTSTESITSDILTVGTETIPECEIQWDCSAISYGSCSQGLKTRDICPGYTSSAECCSDEATCACAALYPEGECDTYTYARPESQKSCIGVADIQPSSAPREETPAEELPEETGGFPWLLVISIILLILAGTGAAAYFLLLKKPETKIPPSLVNYVKAARTKKVPDEAIKQALLKSGWKPDQIKAAFKSAK